MIISPEVLKENTFYQICSKIDKIYYKKFSSQENTKRGRPKKYSDLQLIKCFLYKIKNRIYCLRELETKLKENPLILGIIGLNEVPDHSTLCLRLGELEDKKLDMIFKLTISKLNPDTRINSIDSTALRSSKFDSEAKKGYSTRLKWYKGYKLHLICSNDYIPLTFKITTANVYDNTYEICENLLKELKEYNPFILLGDAGYDSAKLFRLSEKLKFNLLTDINLKNADSIENFTDQCRIENANHFNSPMGEKIYSNRTTIERLFSILKERYNLESPRLYGFRKYKSMLLGRFYFI